MITSLRPAITETLFKKCLISKGNDIDTVGCEYCSASPVTGSLTPLANWLEQNKKKYRGAGAIINLRDKSIDFWTSSSDDFLTSYFTINYCPKCGRKLNDYEE